MAATSSAATASAVPVVDLASPVPEAQLAAVVREACTGPGFFVLTGHGVPKELRSRVFDASKAFFALSAEDKASVVVTNDRGWTPLGEETLDPTTQKRGDTKEGYYIGRERLDPSEVGKPLRFPNVWPDEEALPAARGFRAVMLEYFDAVAAVGMRVLRLVALALGLEPEHFHPNFTHPLNVLRLLHYTPEVSVPEEGTIACGSHTDYGMLTFLATDDVPGLEILLGGEWVALEPRPDDYIVNLGDMLQRWSNGLFHSTTHRVVNRVGRERYSIPFFFEPNFDTLVTAIPQCVPEGQQPRFPPTTSGQFVLDKYAQTHAMHEQQA